ncbi:MAG: LuxR C-terminal-related transcriptional regulator [Planctomycetota bacterium]
MESEVSLSESPENRGWLAQSLTHFGINPCQFFDCVANASPDPATGDPVVLVRNDQKRIQLSILPIISQNLLRGHIVRMEACPRESLLDSILQEVAKAREKLAVLSVRETEILDLVYQGRTNKAISISTTISEKTVEKHRARIMQKLGLLSTAELLRLITKARLTDEVSALQEKQTCAGPAAGLYKDGRLRESA